MNGIVNKLENGIIESCIITGQSDCILIPKRVNKTALVMHEDMLKPNPNILEYYELIEHLGQEVNEYV